MPYPNRRTHFGEYSFDLLNEVYEPAEDTLLFAENLDVKEGERVLDLGTGCGILGILATRKADKVVAVDINPHAVRCAKENAELNGVSFKMDFVQASLFTALSSSAVFDLILFNAPYLPSEKNEATSWIGRSWAGGPSGRDVIDSFITEIAPYLKANGRILLMQSTLTGVKETIHAFRTQGLCAFVKAEHKLPFFETLTLIEARVGL